MLFRSSSGYGKIRLVLANNAGFVFQKLSKCGQLLERFVGRSSTIKEQESFRVKEYSYFITKQFKVIKQTVFKIAAY